MTTCVLCQLIQVHLLHLACFPCPHFWCFCATLSALRDAVNCWSLRMLYSYRRSRVKRCQCVGLIECTILLLTETKKWTSSLSSSACEISFSCLVSPWSSHHWFHSLISLSVFRFVSLLFLSLLPSSFLLVVICFKVLKAQTFFQHFLQCLCKSLFSFI